MRFTTLELIKEYESKRLELPRPTFGNAPRHGGTNMVFGVSAGLGTIKKVTATEAGRRAPTQGGGAVGRGRERKSGVVAPSEKHSA